MASSRRANNWLMFSNGLCVSVAILTHLCCFLTYLFPLTLYSVTLYPLWKEERKNKWLDKHMTIILTCLTRSSASCQMWTHQILQIPVSLQNLFLGIYSLALLYSKTNHLIPHQRCWQQVLTECFTQMIMMSILLPLYLIFLPFFFVTFEKSLFKQNFEYHGYRKMLIFREGGTLILDSTA